MCWIDRSINMCVCSLVAGPCQNSGICNTVVEEFEGDSIARVECQCQPQWTGVFCTDPVSSPGTACLSNPCVNLGTCREVVNGFVCQCLPGKLSIKGCMLSEY